MGSIWCAHLDAIDSQLDWPLSLVHATMHNQAVLYSRQVCQTLGTQLTKNTPLNMKDFPTASPEEWYSLDDIDSKDEEVETPLPDHLEKRM